MAIRMRRGASSDLDTSRLQSGEIVVATNPDKVVAKTPSGNVLTLATTADLQDKVDKVQGKGLSTNDYDNTSKNVVDNIPLTLQQLQGSLAEKLDTSSVGVSVASLNGSGKVPESQLPSYVDDVIEGYLYEGVFYEDAQHTIQITGESSKIYVDLDTDKTYRWSGTVYVCTGSSLEIGEVTGTAYDGGKGKTNADNIAAINDLIPSTASSTNKFATMQDVENATDIETTEGLIEATNGWWGKNELELDNTLQDTTIDGVSFSIGKRNGIVYWISATGTPNNGSDVMLKVAQDVYVNREKILNGCPEGGSDPHPDIDPTPIDRYGLSATSSSVTQIFEYNDVGEGVTIPSGKHCDIYVVIKNGYTADDLTFRPMLRNSKIKDSSFEMYEPNTLERLETKQDKTTFTVSNGRLTFNNIEAAT